MKDSVITKRRKFLLPIILSVVVAVCALCMLACGYDALDRSDVIDMGYGVTVKFDFQGGQVNNDSELTIYVKKDGYVPDPNNDKSSLDAPAYANHAFRDFCVAETDENGELVRDKDGNLVPEKVWDFKTDKATENMTLMARWWPYYKMIIHYGDDTITTDKFDKQSDAVYIARTKYDGDPALLAKESFSVTDYSFHDFYMDSSKSQKLDIANGYLFDKNLFDLSDDKLTVHVYGESIKGNYVLVKTAEDFIGRASTSSTNYYMLDSVDMTAIKDKGFSFPDDYGGKFVGNGKTIRNYSVSKKLVSVSDEYAGLFNSLLSTAEITDLTFENADVNIEVVNPDVNHMNIGFFAGRVQYEDVKDETGNVIGLNAAKVSDVKIGGKIAYTIPSKFSNEKLVFDKFIAVTEDKAIVTGSGSLAVTESGSQAVIADTGDYAVYVKFDRTDDGNITVTELYGLCSVGAGGALTKISNKTDGITDNKDGTYKFEARKDTYNITVSVTDKKITATVSKAAA